MAETGKLRVRKRLIIYLTAAVVFGGVVASLNLTPRWKPLAWIGRLPAYLVFPSVSETPRDIVWSSLLSSLAWLAPLPLYPRRGKGRWRWGVYAGAVAVELGLAVWSVSRLMDPWGRGVGLHYPVGGLPDGYSWECVEGPDFFVFYGNPSDETKRSGVGLFVGGFPNAFVEDDARCTPGKVGPRAVSWAIGDTEREHAWFRETHFGLRPWQWAKIHLWVFADSEAELNTLLKALENLRLEEFRRAADLPFAVLPPGCEAATSRPDSAELSTRPTSSAPEK